MQSVIVSIGFPDVISLLIENDGNFTGADNAEESLKDLSGDGIL